MDSCVPAAVKAPTAFVVICVLLAFVMHSYCLSAANRKQSLSIQADSFQHAGCYEKSMNAFLLLAALSCNHIVI